MEFFLFFSSLLLSVGPLISSVDASLVEVAVFGLSSGFSDGSTTVAPLLVLQPMIWQNLRVYNMLFSRWESRGVWSVKTPVVTFKPVEVLWVQVFLFSMATLRLPVGFRHLAVCCPPFTSLCLLAVLPFYLLSNIG